MVTKMWTRVNYTPPRHSWLSGPAEAHRFVSASAPHEDGSDRSKDTPPSQKVLHQYEKVAEAGISEIQDPLWRMICVDILRVLGPIAFKDFWKIMLIKVSPEKKRAYLVCPNEVVAETIEQFHFVVIGALKRFYPFLSSIETEIGQNKTTSTRDFKVEVSLRHHVA